MDHVLSVTAVMPAGTPGQTTQYVYGVTTASGSGLNSNDVPAQVRYADKATGAASTAPADRQTFTVDALGEATDLTDPTAPPTTPWAGVGGAVRRLQTAHDAGGQGLPRPSSTDPDIPHFPPRNGRALPEVGSGHRDRARSDPGNPTPRPR